MVDNDTSMKAILTAFVAIVLFLAFTDVISDGQVANTQLSRILNESVTYFVSGWVNKDESQMASDLSFVYC